MHKRDFLKLGLAAAAAPVALSPALVRAQPAVRLIGALWGGAHFQRALSSFLASNLRVLGVPHANIAIGFPIGGFPRPETIVPASLNQLGFDDLGNGLMTFDDLVNRMRPDGVAGWMAHSLGQPSLEEQLEGSLEQFMKFNEALQGMATTSLTGVEIAGLAIGIAGLGLAIYSVYDGWESDADSAFRDRYNLEPHDDYDNDGVENVHDSDLDNDGVSNVNDRYPTDGGTWFNLPDTNGNGIPDELEDEIFGGGSYLLSSLLTGMGVGHLDYSGLKVEASIAAEGDALLIDQAVGIQRQSLVQRTQVTA